VQKTVTTAMFDDTELLRQLALGNELAFVQIIDRHEQKVFSVAYKFLKSREYAKEIVQEVFLRVWNKRDAFSEAKNLEALIYTTTKNLTLNFLEKIANERMAQYKFTQLRDNVSRATEYTLQDHEYEALLQRSLEQLPPQQLLVYQLAKVEGLSYEETAERLNITTNTVKYHIKHIHRFLREKLELNTSMMAIPVLLKILE
jgi:RNA polymerase sigma-70 factor (ECF subfamily)